MKQNFPLHVWLNRSYSNIVTTNIFDEKGVFCIYELLCYYSYIICYHITISNYCLALLLLHQSLNKVNAMNQHATTFEEFFSECYLQYRIVIRRYIASRINHSCDAEDMMQDVFLRLWEYRAFVNKETVRPLLFTIAQNLIIDKIRRYYKKEDFVTYIYNVQEQGRNLTEEQMNLKELKVLHERIIEVLPEKRQQIYKLSFYQEMPNHLIAQKLSLSIRTVEGQLLLSRKFVRNHLCGQYAVTG